MSNEELKKALNDLVAMAVKQASLMDINQMNDVIKAIYTIQENINQKLVD